MSNLRNKVIRLAHSNPSLRPHLLPLLSDKREIAKIAREVKQIKAQLNKESASSNVFSEMVANLFPDPNQVDFIRVDKNWIILKFQDRGEVTNISADFLLGRGILNVHTKLRG